MLVDNFNVVVEARIEEVRETLINKAKEYAPEGGDRLHNFKVAAAMNEVPPEEALWGMLSKHVISVRDMCKGVSPVTQRLIDEKVGDWIVYGFLLEALLLEKLDAEEAKED